jgi:membrane protein implicated in regulation of membrane protease activity
MMDTIVAALAHLQSWHWLAIGLVLVIAEILTGTTYLLWPAAAAAATGLLLFVAPFAWPLQLAVFATLTLVLTLTGRAYMRGRWLTRGGEEQLNDRGAQMIGQVAVADAAFVAGFGRVKYADSVWRAASDEPIEAGAQVEIVGVDGTTMRVKRAT